MHNTNNLQRPMMNGSQVFRRKRASFSSQVKNIVAKNCLLLWRDKKRLKNLLCWPTVLILLLWWVSQRKILT